MLWVNKAAFSHINSCQRVREGTDMKFSFVKNDVTTYWDEVGLILITLIALVIGILLIVFRPSFWIVTESISVGLGVLSLMLVFMYIPCIIYRLLENRIDKK